MRIGGMMRINRITGRVLNWSPVEISGLHVYSLVMKSRHIIDATGHAIGGKSGRKKFCRP
ncbi:MAG: hypothetical protein PHY78_15995 [Desulfobacterales bacterium]|nr:hypothetical protein [Desulfobacterales bacterium]MDD4391293.1 hypothetical protein [Desulfobacterales bacterium]